MSRKKKGPTLVKKRKIIPRSSKRGEASVFVQKQKREQLAAGGRAKRPAAGVKGFGRTKKSDEESRPKKEPSKELRRTCKTDAQDRSNKKCENGRRENWKRRGRGGHLELNKTGLKSGRGPLPSQPEKVEGRG